MEPDIRISVRNAVKAYGGVPVLKGIDFECRLGSIHALLGGNGAGKSTLMKLIAGLIRLDAGEITIKGTRLSPPSVKLSHYLGVYLVPQEAHVFPHLSILENILIGIEGSKKDLASKVQRCAKQLNVSFDLHLHAETLEIADRQIVEIMRGLVREASFLILDEPTSALTPREAGALFDTMRSLRDAGVGLIFISHKLREIREICDNFTVMRDGDLILTGALQEFTDRQLVEAMTNVSKEVASHHPCRGRLADARLPVLKVEGLSGEGFHDVSFSLEPGEIVGLTGVVGSGRTELAETIVGLRTRAGGAITIGETPNVNLTPRKCLELGLVYLPEDRQLNGLFLEAPLSWNISSAVLHRSRFVLSRKQESDATQNSIVHLGIKCQGPGQMAGRLSGGNQQKVLLAKCLSSAPRVLIIDEPTRGVDVSARTDIYQILRNLADRGTAVLVISSDFEEIEGLAVRVLVMTHGAVSGSLSRTTVSVHEIARLAFAASGH